MALVNSQIKRATPRDTDYKMADGEGMYLLVKKNGDWITVSETSAKPWRWASPVSA